MKVIWRIAPGLSGLSKVWCVYRVTKGDGGGESTAAFGCHKTLKAAKSVVAHLKRKPIELQ